MVKVDESQLLNLKYKCFGQNVVRYVFDGKTTAQFTMFSLVFIFSTIYHICLTNVCVLLYQPGKFQLHFSYIIPELLGMFKKHLLFARPKFRMPSVTKLVLAYSPILNMNT